jgi:16S rRNA processing protein RimM
MVLVGRVARPHGLRGHVAVDPETDFVKTRFAEGAQLWTRSGNGMTELTITSSRLLGRRPIVAFTGRTRLEDVETLVGFELRVPEEALQPLPAGRYYHHQLRGCLVETMSGLLLGRVSRVETGVGDGFLVVTGSDGEVLIPLAKGICVEIDILLGRIRVDPPEGLIGLNEPSGQRSQPGDMKEK